jgi:hypothetical protein
VSAHRILAAVSCVLWVATGPVAAQWLRYPTPGVPKTRDGKPNLSAPPPKAADGKPDLSGIWITSADVPCQPGVRTRFAECGVSLPISPQAFDIGTGVAGGLPFQPWAAELARKRTEDLSKDDPHAHCLPTNVPRGYGLPHLHKIVQVPGLLVTLNEFNAEYRQIFTDGRPLPVDPQPAWNGYSVGTWEGTTLVVTTIGLRDDSWLDTHGTPMTNAATITERLRRPTFGTLEVDVTIDDPRAYTRPWTVRMNQSLKLDVELIDEICLENNKSIQHMVGK